MAGPFFRSEAPHGSAYAHRRRWPDFARRWDETLDEAVMRLEMALVERGGNPLSGEEAPSGNPIRPMSASEAIWTIEMFRRRQQGHPRPPGRWRRPLQLDDVRESILRKLRAFERARGVSEAEKAKERSAWRKRRRDG